MTRGTPNPDYYKLSREDEKKLKKLLQYAFFDEPTFDGLTEEERRIFGDAETFVRIVSWSCEGEANPYIVHEHITANGDVTQSGELCVRDDCPPTNVTDLYLFNNPDRSHAPLCASRPTEDCTCGDFKERDRSHAPLCASRAGGECTCGEFERQDREELPTVTLEELRSTAHELHPPYPKVSRGDAELIRELLE